MAEAVLIGIGSIVISGVLVWYTLFFIAMVWATLLFNGVKAVKEEWPSILVCAVGCVLGWLGWWVFIGSHITISFS